LGRVEDGERKDRLTADMKERRRRGRRGGEESMLEEEGGEVRGLRKAGFVPSFVVEDLSLRERRCLGET